MRAAFGPILGVFLIIVLVIGGLAWMPTARLVRAEFLSVKEKEFVEAARAMGAHVGVDHRQAHPAERAVAGDRVGESGGGGGDHRGERRSQFLGDRLRAGRADVGAAAERVAGLPGHRVVDGGGAGADDLPDGADRSTSSATGCATPSTPQDPVAPPRPSRPSIRSETRPHRGPRLLLRAVALIRPRSYFMTVHHKSADIPVYTDEWIATKE